MSEEQLVKTGLTLPSVDAAHAALGQATSFEGLNVDRSPAGIIFRRTQFLTRYLFGIVYRKKIARLLPIVEKSFESAWVAAVQLKLRFLPGNDSRSVGTLGKRESKGSMHWDAPITISIFRRRRGRNRQALCMSIYMADGLVYIAQLQGVTGTTPPAELRHWPKIFMEACRTFARQEGLRGVRVPHAESLYSYCNPGLDPELSPAARSAALQRIRRSMNLLYDTNALDLGFVSDGDWLTWENSPKQSS